MVKRNFFVTLVAFMLLVGVASCDIAGLFGYSDTPFAIMFLGYGAMVFLVRTVSRGVFVIAGIFLIATWASYIVIGPEKTTERLGEWFYLTFVLALIQYAYEVYYLRKK